MKKKGFYLAVIFPAILLVIVSSAYACCVKDYQPNSCSEGSCVGGGTDVPGACSSASECNIGCCCGLDAIYQSEMITFDSRCSYLGGTLGTVFSRGTDATSWRQEPYISTCTNECGGAQPCTYTSCDGTEAEACICGSLTAQAGQYCCSSQNYVGTNQATCQNTCSPVAQYFIEGYVKNWVDMTGIEGASVTLTLGGVQKTATTNSDGYFITTSAYTTTGIGTAIASKSGWTLDSSVPFTITGAFSVVALDDTLYMTSNAEICETPPSYTYDYDGDGCKAALDKDCGGKEDVDARGSTISGGCSDGIDNDCDNQIDCGDSDCVGDIACSFCGNGVVEAGRGEQCDDGNTANGDGCSSTCQFEHETNCRDGLDNDNDGNIDCLDQDCSTYESAIHGCCGVISAQQQAQGITNPDVYGANTDEDGDGCYDTVDSDCANAEGIANTGKENYDQNGLENKGRCTDLLDNDCDGLPNCYDPDCQIYTDICIVTTTPCTYTRCEQPAAAACACGTSGAAYGDYCCAAENFFSPDQLACYAQTSCIPSCTRPADVTPINNLPLTEGMSCRCGSSLATVTDFSPQYCCSSGALASTPYECPSYVPTKELTILVIDSGTRLPIANAQVSILLSSVVVYSGTTDSTGTLKRIVNKGNTYDVTAYKSPEYDPNSVSVYIEDTVDPQQVTIELNKKPVWNIGGQVKAADTGALIGGATIRVIGTSFITTSTAVLLPGYPSINFLFSGMYEGTYQLIAEATGYQSKTLPPITITTNNYGLLFELQPLKCTSQTTTPAPDTLTATAVLGQPKINLAWNNECSANYYEIKRCGASGKGKNDPCIAAGTCCTPSIVHDSTLIQTYTDNNRGLGVRPDVVYCYTLTSVYLSFPNQQEQSALKQVQRNAFTMMA